jgi:hypothetical protein
MEKKHQRRLLIYAIATLTLISIFAILFIHKPLSVVGYASVPNGQSTVTRSFDATNVIGGSSIQTTLTIDVRNGETFYAIQENIPVGFSVTNAGEGNYNSVDRTIRWAYLNTADPNASIPISELTKTYTVTAAPSAGTYTFSGQYQFEGDALPLTTGGTSQIIVTGSATDTTPPTVSNLLARPSTVPVSTAVNLSANVTDTGGVQSVIINVDNLVNYTTIKSGNEYYTTNAATGIVGPYTYRIIATDNAGNVNSGQTGAFNVVDTTSPWSNTPDNYAYQVGSVGTINWILNDNYAPGKYTVRRNGTIQNNTLSWTNGQNLHVAVNTQTVGIWTYIINFNDSSGNNGQDTVIITVTTIVPDNHPVVVLDSPIDGFTSSNGSVTFMCNATDDNLLTNLTLRYIVSHNMSAGMAMSTTTTSPLVHTISNLTNSTVTWTCFAYDNTSQIGWGENRTLTVIIQPCVETWTCTGYSQTTCGDRTCTDQDSCGTTINQPTTHIDCPTTPTPSSSPIIFKGGGGGGSPGASAAAVR